MDKDKDIPYYALEGLLVWVHDMFVKMLMIIVLLIVLFVGSNIAWIIHESQFTEVSSVTETYEAEADESGIAIVNGDGEVNYGEG